MYNLLVLQDHMILDTRSMPKIQGSTEERVSHRVRLQGEMMFELHFERAVV